MRPRIWSMTRAERLAAKRATTRRRAGRTGKLFAAAIVATCIVTTTGIAYWTSGALGSGSGVAAGLASPSNLAGSATSGAVHLSWNGVTPPGAGIFGYYVERFSSVDGYTAAATAGGTCASTQSALLVAMPNSCDDLGLAPGSYKYRVTAVFGTWTAASALTNPITVFLLDHFAITVNTSTTAGTPLSVTIAAKDAANATITNYAGTIHFQTSDAQGTVPANYAFVPADNGAHTFPAGLVLRTAGTQTVSVNDTVILGATGSVPITVAPGPLDHFVVTAPATTTAGTAFNTTTVAARDAYGNVPTAWVSTNQCVTFSGAASSPSGNAPQYPPQGTCTAGQSQLTFNASGTASGFSITLFNAASTTLTATAATKTGSATVNVIAGSAAGITYTNASNRNGPVGVTCTGPITNLTCTPASPNGNGNSRMFQASVSLVDVYQNVAVNTTGAPLTIALTRVGGTSLTPTSLTINANQSTTTSQFVLGDLRNGNFAMTITATATLNAAPVKVTLTTT